jgi:SAM-dependent methyltransferase
MTLKTSERITPGNFQSKEEYLMYLRHLFAYEFAENELPGNCLVLEVGSGEGYGTYKLSGSSKVKEITGLDVDAGSIRSASGKYISKNLRFFSYDGNRIPYEDQAFDAVISFQVIEHIRDDRNYVREIFRVLKKNGLFLLTTPNRTTRLKPGQKPWNRFHIREYSSVTLREVLQHSFSEVEILGIRGKNEIEKIDAERVRMAVSLYALDPFNIRLLVPTAIKSFAVRMLTSSRSGNTSKDEDFISRYTVRDYYTIFDDLDKSLDLLARCYKR